MFPLSDQSFGSKGLARATILIILTNIFVFAAFQDFGTNDKFTYSLAMVPQEVLTNRDIIRAVPVADPLTGAILAKINLRPTPVPVWLTVITSMFMHGGFAHLLGNMVFLWVFGDNVEHAMKSGRFLVFYLVCGIAAAMAQIAATFFTGGNMFMPMIGASGAISGVLAAYLVLFPRNRIYALIGIFVAPVPAYIMIGFWFVFQILSGIGLLGDRSAIGGIAYAAHVGGFIAGLILVRLFDSHIRPNAPRVKHQRDFQRV